MISDLSFRSVAVCTDAVQAPRTQKHARGIPSPCAQEVVCPVGINKSASASTENTGEMRRHTPIRPFAPASSEEPEDQFDKIDFHVHLPEMLKTIQRQKDHMRAYATRRYASGDPILEDSSAAGHVAHDNVAENESPSPLNERLSAFGGSSLVGLPGASEVDSSSSPTTQTYPKMYESDGGSSSSGGGSPVPQRILKRQTRSSTQSEETDQVRHDADSDSEGGD